MYNKYEDIRKILFIRFGAITDVVYTTLAYQILKQHFKNVHIDYLTSSLMQELLNNDAMLRQVISLDDPTFDGIFRLALKLSDENYDLIVNMQPSLKTHLFTTVLNNRFTFTYKQQKPRKGEKNIHVVENVFNTIAPAIPEVEMPTDLKIYLNNDIVRWAKHRLEKEKITHAIGIIPGVGDYKKGRLWPKEYWRELLDFIANKKGMHVIILGGTNEFELAQELQALNTDKIRNFCGKLGISQTAGILSLCMVVIGGDTGPTHIATAVGPKVIGLYGATDPYRSGLYGRGHEMIISDHDCKFCTKKECSYLSDSQPYSPCMSKISVEQVKTALGI